METSREVLVALAGRYAFGEVAELAAQGAAGSGLPRRDVAQVQQLCAYGQRLLDLDAEDLANPDSAANANTDSSVADLVLGDAVPEDLLARGRACRMPQSPGEDDRGALGSLRPAYRLLLEVIAARWRRRETAALVAAAHIASEYAPLLAWEPVLGHAGDPARLARDPTLAGGGSRFGRIDDADCPHTRPAKSAANRSLRVWHEPESGWKSYLDRQHSTVAHALAVCAAKCPGPCTVVSSRRGAAGLKEACSAALAFANSALVRLRHAAPVGHGFGVPSPAEVAAAWQASRQSIAQHGALAGTVLRDDGFPLPGMPSLFSAIAGTGLVPDTLLADTAARVAELLEGRR